MTDLIHRMAMSLSAFAQNDTESTRIDVGAAATALRTNPPSTGWEGMIKCALASADDIVRMRPNHMRAHVQHMVAAAIGYALLHDPGDLRDPSTHSISIRRVDIE